MADETVKGYNGFTITKQEKVFRVEAGWSLQKSYEGPQALADSFAADLITQGASQLNQSTGVPCVITAQFPLTPSGYNEDQKARDEAIWELIPEPTEKLLASHPAFAAGSLYIPEIDKAIATGDPAIYKPTPDWDTLYAGGGGKLNEYRDLRIAGVDSYQSGVWRVRMAMTVSRLSLITANFSTTWQIVSWSSIGVPSSAKFTQPSLWAWNGSAFAATNINQWLDMGASVRWRKGIRKWEVSQEWVGAVQASGTLYSGGTGT
jgi:hypothetical protein